MSNEFLRLYALATLRARKNTGLLSMALAALQIAVKIKNVQSREKHVARCVFLIKLHGGVV